MPRPLVTIMIPTYNQRGFLREAVDSARQQTYPNLEIIVADDASTDGTPALLQDYADDPRVRVFRNTANLGRVANYRTTLTRRTRGEWVLNLDGDDRLTSRTFVTDAVAASGRSPRVVLVCGRCAALWPDGTRRVLPTNADAPPLMSGRELFFRLPKGRLNILHLAALYRRSTALRHHFYHMDILSSDWESLYRLILEGDVAFVDEVAGDWRRHDASEGVSADMSSRLSNLAMLDSVADSAVRRGRITHAEARHWRRAMRAAELRGILHLEWQRGGPASLPQALHRLPAPLRGAALRALLHPSPWMRRILMAFQSRR